MIWRVKKKCENCPFQTSGPGLHLRKSLGRGRWSGILHSLMADGFFPCHKTVQYDDETGEAKRGSGKACAGALEWQTKNLGHVGQFARIMERAEWLLAQKKDAIKTRLRLLNSSSSAKATTAQQKSLPPSRPAAKNTRLQMETSGCSSKAIGRS